MLKVGTKALGVQRHLAEAGLYWQLRHANSMYPSDVALFLL
jgi:hypothetical protein